MFQRVFSVCSNCASTLFLSFNPFHCSPLPLYHLLLIFQDLSMHILISSTFMYALQYCWCSIILFSFPSSPEFHRVVLLFQTHSTDEFVHEHVHFLCTCYFHSLGIVNSAGMNTSAWESLLHPAVHYFEYMPRGGLTVYLAFLCLAFCERSTLLRIMVN
jgi:hypothetical protein